MPPDVGVVVVAAGQGLRAGGGLPKQFRELAGVPLVLHALRPFLRHPDVACVVLVLPASVAAAPPDWLAGLAGDRLILAAGGATRQDSMRAGVAVLPDNCGVVLVHDGARPLVEDDVVDAVMTAARTGCGAIAAIPESDTLKEVVGHRIVRTHRREGIWRAQTPQGFLRPQLERALAAATGAETDEAALVEALGEEVIVVESSPRNIKVTSAADFAFAELLLGAVR